VSAPSNPGADEEFVERIRATPADDLRDFETLVLRHQRQVRANCRYLTRSEEHAEDLAQEVFLKAYFGLAKFEGRSKFRTWLYTIKIRHCQDFLTKSRRHTFVALEDPAVAAAPELAVSPTAEDALVNAADRKEIGAVLDQFAESLRIPLLLCDLDGLTYQEIADELGLWLSAVKMPIMRARREFRRHFADSSGPAGVGAKPPPPA
jgi:RNA polymerase sigma-70 factor (ECF subfamily)